MAAAAVLGVLDGCMASHLDGFALDEDKFVDLLSKLVGESKYLQNNPPHCTPVEDRGEQMCDQTNPISGTLAIAAFVENYISAPACTTGQSALQLWTLCLDLSLSIAICIHSCPSDRLSQKRIGDIIAHCIYIVAQLEDTCLKC
jgi:hypothetical protein